MASSSPFRFPNAFGRCICMCVCFFSLPLRLRAMRDFLRLSRDVHCFFGWLVLLCLVDSVFAVVVCWRRERDDERRCEEGNSKIRKKTYMIIKLRSLNGVCSTIHLIRKLTVALYLLSALLSLALVVGTHTHTHRRQLLLLLLICCIRLFLFDSFEIFAFLRRPLCLLSVSSIYVYSFSRSRCTFDRNRIARATNRIAQSVAEWNCNAVELHSGTILHCILRFHVSKCHCAPASIGRTGGENTTQSKTLFIFIKVASVCTCSFQCLLFSTIQQIGYNSLHRLLPSIPLSLPLSLSLSVIVFL